MDNSKTFSKRFMKKNLKMNSKRIKFGMNID